MVKSIILVLPAIKFYSLYDEESLFEWAEKITCIFINVTQCQKEIHLYISSKRISKKSLLNLTGLFERYKLDWQHLRIFATKTTKKWFDEEKYNKQDRKRRYTQEIINVNNTYFTCKGVTFYSMIDEDMFFAWIKKIKCIASFEGAGDELYLDLISPDLKYDDIKDITALFYRYKINMKQLKPFLTQENKEAFKPWQRQIFGKKVL